MVTSDFVISNAHDTIVSKLSGPLKSTNPLTHGCSTDFVWKTISPTQPVIHTALQLVSPMSTIGSNTVWNSNCTTTTGWTIWIKSYSSIVTKPTLLFWTNDEINDLWRLQRRQHMVEQLHLVDDSVGSLVYETTIYCNTQTTCRIQDQHTQPNLPLTTKNNKIKQKFSKIFKNLCFNCDVSFQMVELAVIASTFSLLSPGLLQVNSNHW